MQEIFLLEDLLNVLIELEILGNVHYSKMAQETVHVELKKLFERLSKEENVHKEIYLDFRERKINFVSNEVTSEYKEYMDALLKNTLSLLKVEYSFEGFEAGFALAIKLEKETILFLTEMKQIISQAYHEDINQIMDQERQHLKYLLTYKGE